MVKTEYCSFSTEPATAAHNVWIGQGVVCESVNKDSCTKPNKKSTSWKLKASIMEDFSCTISVSSLVPSPIVEEKGPDTHRLSMCQKCSVKHSVNQFNMWTQWYTEIYGNCRAAERVLLQTPDHLLPCFSVEHTTYKCTVQFKHRSVIENRRYTLANIL